MFCECKRKLLLMKKNSNEYSNSTYFRMIFHSQKHKYFQNNFQKIPVGLVASAICIHIDTSSNRHKVYCNCMLRCSENNATQNIIGLLMIINSFYYDIETSFCKNPSICMNIPKEISSNNIRGG